MNIHIEGNIGAGKTTLLNFINENFECNISSEPVEEWMSLTDGTDNILDKFYKDIGRWSFAFQMNCFISRVHQVKKMPKGGLNFIERSIHSDKIFAANCHASGNMNDIEMAIYNNWSSWLEYELCDKIDAVIYLRSTPEVSLQRIKERGRPGEESIGIDYLTSIHQLHEHWLNNTDLKVYTLNADTVDYSNPEVYEAIRQIIQ